MGSRFGLDIAEPGRCAGSQEPFGKGEPGWVHEHCVAVGVRFGREAGDTFGLRGEADAGGVPRGVLLEIRADIARYLIEGFLVGEVAEIEAAIADQGAGEVVRLCRFGVKGIHFWSLMLLSFLGGGLS